jgi:O-antigen ligase
MISKRDPRIYLGLIAFVVLCTTGAENIKSHKVLALLPWLFLLIFRSEGSAALQLVATHYRSAVIATVALSLAIVASETVHGFTSLGARHAIVAVAWIPLAALVVLILPQRTASAREFAIAITAALAVNVITLAAQRFVFGQERPLGLGHNVIGGSLAWMGVCTVYVLIKGFAQPDRIPRDQLLLTTSVVLALSAVILSGARTPLLAVCISLTTLVVAMRKRGARFVAAGVAVIVTILFAIGNARLSEFAIEATAYLAGDHLSSVGGRLDAWRWFSETWSQSPWFGISSDGVRIALANRGDTWLVPQEKLVAMTHLHNDVIQISSAYGFVTATAFIAMLISFFVHSYSRIRGGASRRQSIGLYPYGGVLVVTLLFAFAGLTDSLTYWSSSWVAWSAYMAIVIGLTIVYATKTTSINDTQMDR